MKKLFLITIAVLCVSIGHAQNPFEKFGYTPKIGTLSKGKYIEHFDNDSIVRIGSVLFNPFTKSIVGFVETDKVYSEATLKPEIVSRWLSPDPLTEEREWLTPYNFVQNDPINRIDPDGALDEMIQQPDDRYRLLSDGTVEYYDNKGGESLDYLMDTNGNEIQVTDTSILPELEKIKETSQDSEHGELNFRDVTRGEDNQSSLFKVFNFAANNSNVEWSLYRLNIDGTTKFNLGSYGNRTLSPGGSKFDKSQWVAGIHSHPNIPTTTIREIGSMYGDRSRSQTQIRRNGQAAGLKYVYFPNSNNIYNISNRNTYVSFIRNTGGDYKRFFFGTLNTK
ncbi:hypothetical protein LV716_17360 [Flagellimonas sp. HMM57]|uniref:JAB-like toxin 1 domain-containing protein n=1 Tax=unclassified Flagellimonas TaxID=2644544 RepID=UPI0013D55838|nr:MULTISPECIES: JAB-like toxin 1 domain-containing protein [unclassified Flagellimonas]UII76011.1 hypothetical protein LV716_17360 [Flagellimonas sp. HMM57]